MKFGLGHLKMVYNLSNFPSNDTENKLLVGKFCPLYQNKGNREDSTITRYFTEQKNGQRNFVHYFKEFHYFKVLYIKVSL